MEGGANPQHRCPGFVSKPNHTLPDLKFLLFFLHFDLVGFCANKGMGQENVDKYQFHRRTFLLNMTQSQIAESRRRQFFE